MELGQVKANPEQAWHVLGVQLLSEFLVLMLESDQLHKCQLLRQTKRWLPHWSPSPLVRSGLRAGTACYLCLYHPHPRTTWYRAGVL